VALFFCCSSLSHMYQEPQYLRQHHGPLSTPSVVRTSSLSRRELPALSAPPHSPVISRSSDLAPSLQLPRYKIERIRVL
jgi:hypothetical protein